MSKRLVALQRLTLFALPLLFALAACESAAGDADSASGDAGADVVAPDDGSGGADALVDGVTPPTDVPVTQDVPLADTPGPDVPAPIGPAVRFDRAGEDFFDSPFPSLLRVTETGALDWGNVPNPGHVPLIPSYAGHVMTLVDGAGCNTAVYFGLDARLDTALLPSPAESMQGDARVQLVDVDPDSPERGQRIPVNVRLETEAKGGFFTPPVLVVQPVFGFPLRGDTVYAVLLLRSLRGTNGGNLQVLPEVSAALAGNAEAGVQAAFQPLADALPDLGLGADSIAAATVFRTHDPTAELAELRDYVWTMDELPAVLSVDIASDRDGYTIYEGRFRSWNFQQGTVPYTREGGFWHEEDGTPGTVREDLTFSLVVPDETVETSPGRTPMVIYSHGTYGDHTSCYDVAGKLAGIGLSTFCISQPLHGDRWSGSDGGDLELMAFNFTNPPAGVTGFRQAALDNVIVTRLLKDVGTFTLPTDHATRTLRVDPDELYFFGHSQGGIVGAMFFGVEPLVRGGVLSGAGGLMTQTILYRSESFNGLTVRQLVATAARVQADTLSADHPLLVMVQTVTDLTDPINYARLVNVPGNRKHIMFTEGTVDPDTPPEASEPLGTALRLPLLDPIAQLPEGHALRGLADPIATPVSATIDTGDGTMATAFFVQFENWGHFAVFQNPTARDLYRALFTSMTERDVPIVDP